MTARPLTRHEQEEIAESHAYLRVARAILAAKGFDFAAPWDGRALALPGEEPETFEPTRPRPLLPAVTAAELRNEWQRAREGMHRGFGYEHPWTPQAALDPRLRGRPLLWFRSRDPDSRHPPVAMIVTPGGPAPWHLAAVASLAWFDPT